jgi:hypothetical protein
VDATLMVLEDKRIQSRTSLTSSVIPSSKHLRISINWPATTNLRIVALLDVSGCLVLA